MKRIIRVKSGNLEITENSLLSRTFEREHKHIPEMAAACEEIDRYIEEAMYQEPDDREAYVNAVYNSCWDKRVEYYNRMHGNTGDPEWDADMAEAIAILELEERTGLG